MTDGRRNTKIYKMTKKRGCNSKAIWDIYLEVQYVIFKGTILEKIDVF